MIEAPKLQLIDFAPLINFKCLLPATPSTISEFRDGCDKLIPAPLARKGLAKESSGPLFRPWPLLEMARFLLPAFDMIVLGPISGTSPHPASTEQQNH